MELSRQLHDELRVIFPESSAKGDLLAHGAMELEQSFVQVGNLTHAFPSSYTELSEAISQLNALRGKTN